jgi:hypothetical protein
MVKLTAQSMIYCSGEAQSGRADGGMSGEAEGTARQWRRDGVVVVAERDVAVAAEVGTQRQEQRAAWRGKERGGGGRRHGSRGKERGSDGGDRG